MFQLFENLFLSKYPLMTQFFTYISIEETPVYMETNVLKIEHVFSQSPNIVIQEQVLISVAEIDTT